MNETRQLSEFAAGLKYKQLPTSIVERTKELILDQLTIQIGLSAMPWLTMAYDYVRQQGGVQESTVVGRGTRTSAENAAFVNGTFGHGFELDDVYAPALSHPGPVVVSAALALAERQETHGSEFITAVVAGYEIMGRVGRALAPSLLYRGFFPTSVSGSLGAAAAAGRLLNLDMKTMVNAMGVAGSFSSGLTEHLRGGGEIKRYHAGIAASGGVRAARLAELGVTGPPTVVEGDYGLRVFTNDFRGQALITDLGEQFVIGAIWQKKYGFNGMLHAPSDALNLLRAKHRIDVNDIDEIVVGSNRHAANAVGHMRTPTDVFSFQFSVYYILALQLVRGGAVLGDFTAATLADPAVSRMAERIRIEIDPHIDSLFPDKIGARVTLTMKDGRQLSETVEDCRGTPGNPMSEAERIEKARDVAGMTMSPQKIDRLIEQVNSLDKLSNMREFSRMLSSN